MEFIKAYNEATREMIGTVVPVDVTIYSDRSFTFVLRRPPVAELLKRAAGVEKGSSAPNRIKVGKVTRQQIREIAQLKMPDLNTDDLEAAIRMVEGTARSMGIEIVP
jgi:large subunit ribosomal protein L11